MSAHLDERLHDDRAAITDLAQRRPDFVPGQPALAGNAAIVLAGVEMAEQRARCPDRLAEAVLLDVHMERIEHDLDVRLADLPDEGDPLFGGVEDMILEPVEHLQAEVNAEIACKIGETGDALQASRPVPRLVDGLRIIDRPIGVQSAANDADLEFGEVGQGLFEKGPPRFSDRRVGGREVLLLGWTQAGGDRDAVISSRAADLSNMRRAVAIEVMGGDLDDIEPQFGDFLDVFQAVGAPLLLPVRVINAEFQLRLHLNGKRHRHWGLRSRLRMRADNMGDDGVHAGVAGRVVRDHLTLAQDDDAVGDREHVG